MSECILSVESMQALGSQGVTTEEIRPSSSAGAFIVDASLISHIGTPSSSRDISKPHPRPSESRLPIWFVHANWDLVGTDGETNQPRINTNWWWCGENNQHEDKLPSTVSFGIVNKVNSPMISSTRGWTLKAFLPQNGLQSMMHLVTCDVMY